MRSDWRQDLYEVFRFVCFDYQYPAYDGVNGIKNDKAAQDLQKKAFSSIMKSAVCNSGPYVGRSLKSMLLLSSSLSAMRMMTTKSS